MNETQGFIAGAMLAVALGIYTFWPENVFASQRQKTRLDYLLERKDQLYENLRDLQFEFRVGKLSEADYQKTKQDLQGELARVLAEVDRVRAGLAAPPLRPKAPSVEPAKTKSTGLVCPSCGAKFEKELKFCGECGKPMKAAKS